MPKAKRVDRFAIGVVIGVAAAYGLAFGLTFPLLAIILEGQGVSATLIGFNTAMTPLGIVVSAPFIPWLARRFGAMRLAIFCALATAVIYAMIGMFQNVWVWFPLRFLLGASIDSLYIISETWLLQLAGRQYRGRLIGLYSTAMAVGFSVGPFVLAVVGSQGWYAFGAGIAVMILTAPGLLLLRSRPLSTHQQASAHILRFISLAPMMLLTIAVIALFDQISLSLLPVYLLDHNMSEAMASIALGVFAVGNVALQIPIGWLSDHWSRTGVGYVCLVLVLLCIAALPMVVETSVLWPVLFVLGSAGFGIYTITLAELGDRFEGEWLLAGNAAFALMWGLGGISGPPLSGFAMDAIGVNGLPLILFLAFCLLLPALYRPVRALSPP